MSIQAIETSAGFILHAREFLIAAELVLNQAREVSLPTYFLFGRSVELSLKAYLLKSGVKIETLRSQNKYGHNLETLLDDAIKHKLLECVPIGQIEIDVIRQLNFDYASKRLEYRITGGQYLLPLINVTEDVARKLVLGLQNVCTE
jgi:hypothetical protein